MVDIAYLFFGFTQNTRLTTPLGAHLALCSLIGQPALLALLTVDHSCRPLHGHVTMVEQSGTNGWRKTRRRNPASSGAP